MSRERHLHGSCSCGRNNYVILVPENATEHANVFFEADNSNKAGQGLLSAFLRVPLAWYQSSTTSFFPDETHSSIRRSFTPYHEPHSKRHFCGICGTHLSYWTEEPASEADFISATVGSLRGEDIRALEYLELLPEDLDIDSLAQGSSQAEVSATREEGSTNQVLQHGHGGNISWFEEMIDGSRLGRTSKTRRGIGQSADGTSTIEWEITEFDEGEPVTATANSKRKLGAVASGDDGELK